jgi:DivIVA domain-containing protein
MGLAPRRGPTELDVGGIDATRRDLPRARFVLGYRAVEVDAFLDEAIGSLRELVAENDGLRAGVAAEQLWSGRSRADERLTPLGVQAQVFQPARLGRVYRMREVDELLDELTDLLSLLVAENEALRARRPPDGATRT